MPAGSLVPPGDGSLPRRLGASTGPGSERPTDELFDFLLASTIDSIERRLHDEASA